MRSFHPSESLTRCSKFLGSCHIIVYHQPSYPRIPVSGYLPRTFKACRCASVSDKPKFYSSFSIFDHASSTLSCPRSSSTSNQDHQSYPYPQTSSFPSLTSLRITQLFNALSYSILELHLPSPGSETSPLGREVLSGSCTEWSRQHKDRASKQTTSYINNP